VESIRNIIRAHQNFVIAGHVNPDGDAVGSCFALAQMLTNMGKQARVLLEPYNIKFEIIPGAGFLCADLNEVKSFDVFIALDCGDAERLSEKAFEVYSQMPLTACVDHHGTNPGFAKYNYIEKDASSTCEIVYELMKPLCELDMQAASAIYAGMVHDTGGFRYNSVSPKTLEIAAGLVALGIPFTEIYNELLYMHYFNAAKILGKALESAALTCGGQVIYSFITQKMLDEVSAKGSDLDGVPEFLLNTTGVQVALLIYEKNIVTKELKVSFRSRGIGVDKIAQKLGGGGHEYAAGATAFGEIEEVAQNVLAMLEKELA
jgi:phosphoesterase RecJ-like protein